MTTLKSSQTEGIDALSEWLSTWDLQEYAQSLRKQGIKSGNDFKYIKSVQQFEKLLSKLGDISFMDTCKLEDAWKSIVPNPQKPQTQIHFLGDKEKEILNQLNERFTNLSNDIDYVKKSFNGFNESVVQCKKNVNDSSDKMIICINDKRKELLNKIDLIKDKNEKIFNNKLAKLDKMNKICKTNKAEFTTIASNNDITSSNKLVKLQQLLLMNINEDNENNDDEKKNDNNDDINDYFKIIGNECVIPGKTLFVFNQESFKNNLNSNISINCNNVTSKWNLKPSKPPQPKSQPPKSQQPKPKPIVNTNFIFDVFESQYFAITENGTLATGIYGCSYSIVSTKTAFNQGVHKWKIKFIKMGHDFTDPGVITDISKLSTVGRGYHDLKRSQGSACTGYCYMWNDADGQLQGYNNGVLSVNKGNNLKINVNDIVTMILNCNDWTLTFLRNNQQIGSLDLPKNQSYHPMLYTCACRHQQYKLVAPKEEEKEEKKELKPVGNDNFIFDVFESAYFAITNNGTLASGKFNSCYYTIISTKTSFNQGVHKWKIKFIKKGHQWTNPGVITDITKLSGIKRSDGGINDISAHPGYCYMWRDNYGFLHGFNNGTLSVQKGNNIKINVNDIVTMILNCNEWTLTFLRNDQQIGSLNLPKNQSYHPMLYSCSCTYQQYELLRV